MDIWELLEAPAPKGCDGVQNLYSWNLNYDAGTGPFVRFLDLIGWSEENFGENIGENIANQDAHDLRYVELDKLATALREYADRPHEVSAYVSTLMDAEANS